MQPVDADHQPAMTNQEVLAAIADPAYQTELGAYKHRIGNVPPRPLPGRAALDLRRRSGPASTPPRPALNRRRPHRDGRDPAHADAPNTRPGTG